MFETEYFYVVIGIVISVLLPIVYVMLPTETSAEILKKHNGSVFEYAKPYLALGVFSILAGLVIFASLPDKVDTNEALLAGYAFDSTLQKLKK